MIKYSANYTNSNHNFVIQNLSGERIDNQYLPGICILKNILQRGKPTLLSKFLQQKIGSIHYRKDFNKSFALIDTSIPSWTRIIRGNEKGNYFPAKKFFYELIPKYFTDYLFIQQLIIPEMPVNEITMVNVDEFKHQQVDFYLPQAYLIIEIDGSQHSDTLKKDIIRDKHTAKYGIKTIRIKTSDLEAENENFKSAIRTIKNRIEKVVLKQAERREKSSAFISIVDYKNSFKKQSYSKNVYFTATSIMRFQILILDLLENGVLNFDHNWKIELKTDYADSFAELALQDLFKWFEPIFELQNLKWKKPVFTIVPIDTLENFSNSANTIKIDFSITKRYTDEFQNYPNIIFVRSDYLDEYRYFKKGDSRDNLKFSSFVDYDYFKVSSTNSVKYKLQFGGDDSSEKNLLFLLQNIFLQDIPNLKFNEGQLSIIANVLSGNDTIGLLPTGSGKSICYQLSAFLQPAISFVVCPIKSLMYDQKADLEACFVDRVNHMTSDDDSEDKNRTQQEFSQGKYLFLLLSPERFQLKTFREYFSAVNKNFNIAYAVIDEVHCLSEWGHDFRTAYLNLSSTIRKLCNDFTFLGLTATASINVLKDIQIEFGIKQINIKTPVDYTREELDFKVIDDKGDKFTELKNFLTKKNEEDEIFSPKGDDSRCGIIFTPNINGKRGCYKLSVDLSKYFQTDIKYYSGSVPKINDKPIMLDSDFDNYKKQVQREYKENQFTLLTATKAFGMGVNKSNVHYTIHYGIPNSMESLYQEGGRAGRDKLKFKNQKANCVVLLSEGTIPKDLIEQLWIRDISLSKLNEDKKKIDGDLKTNFFLFSSGLDTIEDEFKAIKNLHERYSVSNGKNVRVEGEEVGLKKAKAEKAIYRLSQLGIIEDWTIRNFFNGGEFEVDFQKYDIESIKKSLLKTINKYDPSFTFEAINLDPKYSRLKKILLELSEYSEFDRLVLMLLQWSYDNFTYNRRQSLKNVYENCSEFARDKITSVEFKERLENYFKFTEATYTLQHVAENPQNFEKWFEVFYQIDENLVTDLFILHKERHALRDSLSRFLESYMHNTGLDFISGLLRLWLDDFENIDGRKRLESALKSISEFDESQREIIFKHTLKIGSNFTDKNKNILSELLIEFFRDDSHLYHIQNELSDIFSLTLIIHKTTNKLKVINNKIYGGLKKVK